MIWRNIIKKLFFASLPLLIVPVIFLAFIIHYFGITTDSLLVIIMLAQAYIIWTQVEVALWQSHLSSLKYEPQFKIKVENLRTKPIKQEKALIYNIELGNTGQYLARNVNASIDIKNGEAEQLFKMVGDLSPNESISLLTIKEESLNSCRIFINIDYQNILGDLGGIAFVKDPKFPQFLIIGIEKRKLGVLLNSLEEVTLIFKLFAIKRKHKKIRMANSNKL